MPRVRGSRIAWRAQRLGTAFRYLCDLFVAGTAAGLGDGQLLARYSASKDAAAFEALVARHGPMVLATCRAVLRSEHDVEDAFQTTFLILAKKAHSIRAGDTLGGWLHRVAYRAAVQASVEAKKRRRREAEASAMALHGHVTIRSSRRRRLTTHPARGDRPPAREPALAGRALRPRRADHMTRRPINSAGPCPRSAAGWPGPGSGSRAG